MAFRSEVCRVGTAASVLNHPKKPGPQKVAQGEVSIGTRMDHPIHPIAKDVSIFDLPRATP